MNKCALLKYRGHLGLNQGPLDLQSNALLLIYTELYPQLYPHEYGNK